MLKGENEMGPLVLLLALMIFAPGSYVGRASKTTTTKKECEVPAKTSRASSEPVGGSHTEADIFPCPKCQYPVRYAFCICPACGNDLFDRDDFFMENPVFGPNLDDGFPVPGHDYGLPNFSFRPANKDGQIMVPDFGPDTGFGLGESATPIFDGAFGPARKREDAAPAKPGIVVPDFGGDLGRGPAETPVFDSAFGPSDSNFDFGPTSRGFQVPPVSPHDRRREMPIFDGAFGPSDSNFDNAFGPDDGGFQMPPLAAANPPKPKK